MTHALSGVRRANGDHILEHGLALSIDTVQNARRYMPEGMGGVINIPMHLGQQGA